VNEPTIWMKAKAEIQRRGWYQGGFAESADPLDLPDCRVCIGGAILAAATGNPWPTVHGERVALRALLRLDQRLGPGRRLLREPRYWVIGEWNDDPERSIEDVYALLDELDAEAQS
jgi:hypothetical protein